MNNEEEEQSVSRWGCNNYFNGRVEKVVSVSIDKEAIEKILSILAKQNSKKPYREEESCEEELFHFIHPEVEDEEAVRIHMAIKRAVAYQRIPEICAYLKELKQKGKVMLPPSPIVMNKELVRLGMPNGKGFGEKYFCNIYSNIYTT